MKNPGRLMDWRRVLVGPLGGQGWSHTQAYTTTHGDSGHVGSRERLAALAAAGEARQ